MVPDPARQADGQTIQPHRGKREAGQLSHSAPKALTGKRAGHTLGMTRSAKAVREVAAGAQHHKRRSIGGYPIAYRVGHWQGKFGSGLVCDHAWIIGWVRSDVRYFLEFCSVYCSSANS